MNAEKPSLLNYRIEGNKIAITDQQLHHPLNEDTQEIITGAKEINCLIFAINKSMVDLRKKLEVRITFMGKVEIHQEDRFDQSDAENFMSYVDEEFQIMLQGYPSI